MRLTIIGKVYMIFGRTVKGKRDYYGNQYTFNGTDRRTVSYDPDGIYYCKDRIVKGRKTAKSFLKLYYI